ncbi:MAG: putative membrane-bound dehydrogenase-like protein [Rhodothermales bacterium]
MTRWMPRALAALLSICASAQTQSFPYHKPREAMQTILLPRDYQLELVASEPTIMEPVDVAWDPNGRMFVLEMRSYMQDEHGTGTKTDRTSRILRMEDTNDDGRMDRYSVFAQDLLLPRMILPLDHRVIVQETDDSSLWLYTDENDDGVADTRELFWQGSPKTNSVEHQDSGLTWALDNWMYSSQGGQRWRFTRGKVETDRILGRFNQWGVGMDDNGRLFYCFNSEPARGFQQDWAYWNLIAEKEEWKRFKPPTLGDDVDDAFRKVYSINAVGDRGDGPLKSFTAASGLSIFRGDRLPKEVQGNAFICEPCGHLVRRAVIHDEKGKLSLKNAYLGKEFLASTDMHFRPVSSRTGPDGCLYIVDMYRGIIQDSPWVSPEFKTFLQETGLNTHNNHGRVYRVTHKNFTRGDKPQMLEERTIALIAHLSHPNGWWRDTAQRLIILRPDGRSDAVVAALGHLARRGEHVDGRVHALWTLEGLDVVDLDFLADYAFPDPSPRVRLAAVRISERLLSNGDLDALETVATLAADPSPHVRRQVLLALATSRHPAAFDLMERMVEMHLDSEVMYLAGMTALHKHESPFIDSLRDGSAFAGIADSATRLQARRRWQAGIASWTGKSAPITDLSIAEIAQVDRGAQIYNQLCVSCHGADGIGVQPPEGLPLAPPLVDSPRVVGEKEQLVRILMHGLTGEVDGKGYAGGIMAPMGDNDDEWIADVLTYIRQEWSNTAPAIRPDQVATIRRVTTARKTPWTLGELATTLEMPRLSDKRGWVCTSSHYERPQQAVDGKPGGGHKHAWHGVNSAGCWIAVDLGAAHVLGKVALDSYVDNRFPRGYELSLSHDGETWSKPLATGKGEGRFTTISFEPVIARHIKLTQTGESVTRWQISEMEIFGMLAPESPPLSPASAP